MSLNQHLLLSLLFVFLVSVTVGSRASATQFSGVFQGGLKTDEALFIQLISDSSDEGVESLPTQWDWRDVMGQNWLTPVRAQDSCGSCTAFGFASVFESQLKIDSRWSWWNPLISVQSLFACGGGDCVTGWGMGEALEFSQSQGVVDEDCSPYVAASGPDYCRHCGDHKKRRIFLNDFSRITSGVVDQGAIKRALMDGPVWTRMVIYDDFRWHRFGVYRHNGVGAPGDGHTLAIVGYDDRRKSWIVKNSWGEHWGERGYANIHYDDISGVGDETYQFNILPQARSVVLRKLSSSEAAETSELRFKAHSPLDPGLNLLLLASGETSQSLEVASCQTQPDSLLGSGSYCEFTVAGETLGGGIHSFWVQATSPNGRRLRSWPVRAEVSQSSLFAGSEGPFELSLLQGHFNAEGIYSTRLPIRRSLRGVRVEILQQGQVVHHRLAEWVPQNTRLQIDLRGVEVEGPFELRLTEWQGRGAPDRLQPLDQRQGREPASLSWTIFPAEVSQ